MLQVKFGVPWLKTEFVSLALQAGHPFNWATETCDATKKAIFSILTEGPIAINHKRQAYLSRWRKRAKEVEKIEAELFQATNPEVRTIVEGKRPRLFQEMLAEAGFPKAAELSKMLLQGVPMFGPFPKTGVFPDREHEATKTIEDIARAAKWSRKALLGSMRGSGNSEMDEAIFSKTLGEAKVGRARGPLSEEQLSKKWGPLWSPVRRFGVDQGEYRPIDDYSEYGHNSTSATSETINPGGLDNVIGIAKQWAKAVLDKKVVVCLNDGTVLQAPLHGAYSAEEKLVGRSLDLEKAYKQLARDPRQGALAVFAVWDPAAECPRLFEAIALGFGARNSVLGFNWFARALWWLMVHRLQLPVTHFFDDFPHIEIEKTADSGRLAMQGLLELLGWQYKTEGPKSQGFSQVFVTLGCVLDLSQAAKGEILVSNKEERAEKALGMLEAAKREGVLRPASAASLVGMLQFADSHVFAKDGAFGLRSLRVLARAPPTRWGPPMEACLSFWRNYFATARPRRIRARWEKPPLLLFTDGSAEGEDFSEVGIGAVLIDPTAAPCTRFFSAKVPKPMVNSWRMNSQKQIITQAELLPVLVSRYTWRAMMMGRLLLVFVDNDAARFTLIKCSADHPTSLSIAVAVRSIDREHATAAWYERVPSPANISDGPSRGVYGDLLAVGAHRELALLPPEWMTHGPLQEW